MQAVPSAAPAAAPARPGAVAPATPNSGATLPLPAQGASPAPDFLGIFLALQGIVQTAAAAPAPAGVPTTAADPTAPKKKTTPTAQDGASTVALAAPPALAPSATYLGSSPTPEAKGAAQQSIVPVMPQDVASPATNAVAGENALPVQQVAAKLPAPTDSLPALQHAPAPMPPPAPQSPPVLVADPKAANPATPANVPQAGAKQAIGSAVQPVAQDAGAPAKASAPLATPASLVGFTSPENRGTTAPNAATIEAAVQAVAAAPDKRRIDLHLTDTSPAPAISDAPPSSAPASTQAAPPDKTAVSDQVAGAITTHQTQLQQSGRVEIRLDLHPPELGRVRLQLAGTDRDLSVRVVVQQESTGHLVQAQVDSLRSRLADAGISLGQFDVRRDGGGTSSYEQRQAPIVEQDGLSVPKTSASIAAPVGPTQAGSGIDLLA